VIRPVAGHDHTCRRHPLLAALAAAALRTGCGGDDSTATGTAGAAAKTTAAAGATDTIRIKDFLYDPDPVTVKAGQKITIVNEDSAPHTVTQKGASPAFDSDTVKGGASGSITFSKTGTFAYYCLFHPTMKGSVTVEG
jgi:plastocyanin